MRPHGDQQPCVHRCGTVGCLASCRLTRRVAGRYAELRNEHPFPALIREVLGKAREAWAVTPA